VNRLQAQRRRDAAQIISVATSEHGDYFAPFTQHYEEHTM